MQELPENVYTVAAVRAMDRCAIDTYGVAGYELMNRAGQQLFDNARELGADRWCVVCGGGNNAGDGYVIARLALRQGLLFRLIAVADPDTLTGDARRAHDAYLAAGGTIERWSGMLPAGADLLIDAVFGSGLCRPVEGEYLAVIDALNDDPAPVYAVDIPSGLDGDSGQVKGRAVKAARTMSFVGLSGGLFLGRGPDFCGDVYFHDLAIPAECMTQQPVQLRRLRKQELCEAFPPRVKTANKGMFGHVVVLGGGPGMPGAALLAGTAALRAGAGRVTLATHPEHAAAIAAAAPELMSRGIRRASELDELLCRADCLVFGPGLGQSDWAEELYTAAKQDTGTAVWDADALNFLAHDPHAGPGRILTPHPGEAARLLGVSAADVQQDRLAALRELARRYGGTIVLKGACTLVSDAAGEPWLCTDGNPGMAAPGMGDVLSGIIAACVTQGVAARLGVLLHARAGDHAAHAGERGMLASDLFAPLRQAVNP